MILPEPGEDTGIGMYEQNLCSEYHLRTAPYNGTGVYLVSDKYIALISRIVPCGVREAMHLIDAITKNEWDIQPDKAHCDTCLSKPPGGAGYQ